jgi:Outer membrane protein beta-barrel domain
MKKYFRFVHFLWLLSLSQTSWSQQKPLADTTKKAPSRQDLYDQMHGTRGNAPGDKKRKIRYIPITADELMKHDMEVRSFNEPAIKDSLVKQYWGVRMGIGLSGTDNNKFPLFRVNETGNAMGLLLGAVYSRRLTESVWIQPELLFVQKGAKVIGDVGDDVDVVVNMVKIPVLLKGHFGNKTKFFINAGPFVGIAVNGSANGQLRGAPYKEEANFDANHGRTEFGLSVGGGVSLPSTFGTRFQVELRYDFGLGTSSKTPGFTDKLYVGSLTFAYLIPSKKR